MNSLIDRLGDVASPAATTALVALRDAAVDDYTDMLRIAVAEQKRKRVEAEWQSLTLNTVVSAIVDRAPTTAAQFLAVMVEDLCCGRRASSSFQSRSKGTVISMLVPSDKRPVSETGGKLQQEKPFEFKNLKLSTKSAQSSALERTWSERAFSVHYREPRRSACTA